MTATTKKLLAERSTTHGPFSEVARIYHAIDLALASGPSYRRLTAVQLLVLKECAHKMARAVSGDPNEADHWKDIGGYAGLALRELAQ